MKVKQWISLSFITSLTPLFLMATEQTPSMAGIRLVVKCNVLLKRLGQSVEGKANLSPKTIKHWPSFLSGIQNPTTDIKSKLLGWLTKKESAPRLVDSLYETLSEIESHLAEHLATKRLPANEMVTFERTATNDDPRVLDLYNKTTRLKELQTFLKEADSELIQLSLKANTAKQTFEKLEAESSEDVRANTLETEIKGLTKSIQDIERSISGVSAVKPINKISSKPGLKAAEPEESAEAKLARETERARLESEKNALIEKRTNVEVSLNKLKGELQKPVDKARLAFEDIANSRDDFSDRIKSAETERDQIKEEIAKEVPREVFVSLLRHLKVEALYLARREEDKQVAEQARQKEEAARAERERKAALEKQVADLRKNAEEIQKGYTKNGADGTATKKPDAKEIDVDDYVPVKRSTTDVKPTTTEPKPK